MVSHARAAATASVDADTLTANVVLFGRMLMRAGLAIDAEKTRLFAQALSQVGFEQRRDVKAAGRAIFTRKNEERKLYDAAFDLFWRRSTAEGQLSERLPRIRQSEESPADVTLTEDRRSTIDLTDVESTYAPVGANSREQLRTADFATLTAAETRDADAMIAALRLTIPMRPARRPRIQKRGARLAGRVMLRRSLSSGGEIVHWRWLSRARRPRPIVFVCDISGSMERYTRFMVRFAHALTRSGAPLEVFVFGTRLTRITRELRVRSADAALEDVARKVVDWSGGTRIGESLKQLNRDWVRRSIRNGAIVLLVSDGWERGDPELLAREMATLQRSCHRLIWLDPLASRPGFEPTTVGLRAALPHVDDFLPCADVASLEALAHRLSTVTGARTIRHHPSFSLSSSPLPAPGSSFSHA